MGRIAWFDAHARKVTGGATALAAFDGAVAHLSKDLIANTWMHERYGCDGTMQTNRTAAYFEYPSTVAILNREIRYGIEIDFKKVTVRPNAPTRISGPARPERSSVRNHARNTGK